MKVLFALLAICVCSLALDPIEFGIKGQNVTISQVNLKITDCKIGNADFSALRNGNK